MFLACMMLTVLHGAQVIESLVGVLVFDFLGHVLETNKWLAAFSHTLSHPPRTIFFPLVQEACSHGHVLGHCGPEE